MKLNFYLVQQIYKDFFISDCLDDHMPVSENYLIATDQNPELGALELSQEER